MAYRSALVGKVFVLRWIGAPESPDLRTLGRELPEYRRSAGEQLVNLSLIPGDISPPEGAVRKEMESFNRVFVEVCSAIHVVVGGTGFKHAIVRSIVSAFALASRQRGLVHTHGSLDDAIAAIHPSDKEGRTLRARLVAGEFLNGL